MEEVIVAEKWLKNLLHRVLNCEAQIAKVKVLVKILPEEKYSDGEVLDLIVQVINDEEVQF